MTLTVHQFPSLEDNYGFLARDAQTGLVACIDPADADEVLQQLHVLHWELHFILNTHWHGDHTGGNERLREVTGAEVIGPAEVGRKSVVDRIIRPGEQVQLGSTRFDVLDTGGHTTEHVTYFDPVSQIAFVGDTLFAMGCGRIFEGTVPQMWASLSRIAALPPSTTVYCAHEYTEANGRFAVAHDASPAVQERYAEVVEMRRAGQWTVPTTVAQELATNPFLRAPSLMPHLEPEAAFGALRAAKDNFRG